MPSDLTTLFKPGDAGPSVRVRQGVVEAWDASTGDNTIRVAGGELLNVPALTGESASLTAGDVVALLSAGNRWFLLGKVTTPGDPGTVPTWSADITALTGQVDTIQTVTIPAVQNDVTIVQGDVIELNTVTVPAVQADADAAQATAAAAQADATAAALAAAAADVAAAAAQAAADAAQADADSLQIELDAAEVDVAAAQADITTLTGTTIPGLVSDLAGVAADVATAQADVDAILPIGTTDISDDAITTPKIAAGQITAVKIAADTITAAQIAASAITASELAANAVTAGKIAAGTIVAADIAAGTITATEIAANTITAAKIAVGTITGTELSATSIDGKTITGATIRTASSGQRIVLDTSATQFQLYSGLPAETAPVTMESTATAFFLKGPQSTGWTGNAEIRMGDEIILTSPRFVQIAAGDVTLLGNLSLQAGSGSAEINLRSTSGPMSLSTSDDTLSLETDIADIEINAGTSGPGDVVITGDSLTFNGDDVAISRSPASSFSAADITSISSASFIPGTPVVGTAFTAPDTGSVYIVTSAHIASASTANAYIYVSPEVRTGATVGSGTAVHTAATDEGVATGSAVGNIIRIAGSSEILITGLTPGSSYNVRLVYLTTAGTNATIFYRAVLVKPVL